MKAFTLLSQAVAKTLSAQAATKRHAETVNGACTTREVAAELSALLKDEVNAKKIGVALRQRASALPVGGFLVSVDGPIPARAVFVAMQADAIAAAEKAERFAGALEAIADPAAADLRKTAETARKRAAGLQVRIEAEPTADAEPMRRAA
jgi:hypothetical protein